MREIKFFLNVLVYKKYKKICELKGTTIEKELENFVKTQCVFFDFGEKKNENNS
ncbi:MAG: hypothetical protein PHI02_09260 [Sulfurovaceae bacterium]|nr:hypothetical protein [Sulfurovaceae bacterium]MDD5360439.1 hypothetical protein [Sulfurovaceae bacterium]